MRPRAARQAGPCLVPPGNPDCPGTLCKLGWPHIHRDPLAAAKIFVNFNYV